MISIWGLVFLMTGAVLFLPPQLFPAWPWVANSVLGHAGDVISAIGAVVLVGYMGFVYSGSRGIAFWNSALHPIQYMLYSARSGVAALLIYFALRSHQADAGLLEFWLLVTGLVVVLWVIDLRLAYVGGDEGPGAPCTSCWRDP